MEPGNAACVRSQRKYHRFRDGLYEHLRPRHPVRPADAGYERLYYGAGLRHRGNADGAHRRCAEYRAGPGADFWAGNGHPGRCSGHRPVAGRFLRVGASFPDGEKDHPPAEKGNTAQGGTKPAKLETGAVVNVPFFVQNGDVIRVDTRSNEYLDRC